MLINVVLTKHLDIDIFMDTTSTVIIVSIFRYPSWTHVSSVTKI